MAGSLADAQPQQPLLGTTPGLVVRRTFIEFVDGTLDGPVPEGLRRRVSSDPGLVDSCKQEEQRMLDKCKNEEGQVEFAIEGLSDEDEEEAEEGPVGDAPGPLATHSRGPSESAPSPAAREAACAAAALPQDVPHQGPVGLPLEYCINLASRTTPSTAPSEHSSEDTASLPHLHEVASTSSAAPAALAKQGAAADGQWGGLDKLMAENRRLAEENRLLRENARLLAENRMLTKGLKPEHGSPAAFEEAPPGGARTAGRPASRPGLAGGMRPPALGQLAKQGRPPVVAEAGGSHESAPWGARGRPASGSGAGIGTDGAPATTVMLRNLPNNYSRAMVLAMLNDEGFGGAFDFVYLPIDFKSRACLGYAFVNMVSPEAAAALWERFDGYSKWMLPSRKVCNVCWSGPHQGLEAHVERYRNSPVMHPSVPDEYKPVVFSGGVRIVFPPPSKAPRAPRVRNHKDH